MQQVGIRFVDFGFGPAGKAVVLARQLLQRGWHVRVAGHRRAHPLFSGLSHAFPGGIELDEQLPPQAASELDAVISVLDDGVEKKDFRPEVRVVYVDSLSWMWDRIPQPFVSGDAYFAQNFFGVPERIQGLRGRGSSPSFVVGPIIDEPDVGGRPERDENIVVTFGGLSDPIATKYKQALFVKWILLGLKEALGTAPILVCLPDDVREFLDPMAFPSSWTLRQLPHEEFLQTIRRARAVIGLPGMTTLLECAAVGTPFLPLLPNNYSQALILASGIRAQIFPETSAHRMFAASGAAAVGLDELSAVKRVKAAVAAVVELQAGDPVPSFCDDYAALIVASSLESMARRQVEWFSRLGPNGANAIASYIESGGKVLPDTGGALVS